MNLENQGVLTALSNNLRLNSFVKIMAFIKKGRKSSLRMKYNFSKNQVLTRHFMILLAVL